jgi:Protein of unknown function (DUF3052)
MPAYSGTPLAKKLGIRENFRILVINMPEDYQEMFTDWPEKVEWTCDPRVRKNFIHFFANESAQLYSLLPDLVNEIEQDGMIWVSWPKKASGVKTDVSENVIRTFALETGLVDIKVCSINDTWSGLKLVIPLKSRKPQKPK